jgi:hypothetical protein
MSSQNVFQLNEQPPSYSSIKLFSKTEPPTSPSCPTFHESLVDSEEHTYAAGLVNRLDEVTEENAQQTLSLEQRFINVVKRHNITRFFFDLLTKHLFGSKLVFICDDSATLSHFSHNSPPSSETRQFLRAAIEIAGLANPSGVDVFFVRRPTARRIKHLNDLEPFLLSEPTVVDSNNNYNTLTDVVLWVLAENSKETLGEFGVHLVVLGDAEPVGTMSLSGAHVFMAEMRQRETHVFTTWVSFSKRADAGQILKRWTTGRQSTPLSRFMASQHISVDRRFRAIEQQCSVEPKYSLGDYVALNLIGCLDSDVRGFDTSLVDVSATVGKPVRADGRPIGRSGRSEANGDESTTTCTCCIS